MRYVNLDGGQFFGPPPPSDSTGGMTVLSGDLTAPTGTELLVEGSLSITGTGQLVVSPGADVLLSA